MTEITIDVSELRRGDASKGKELSEFLGDRLGVDVTIKEGTIILSEDTAKKDYVRVLVSKFLHKSGLKERYRPISNRGNIVIKRRRKVEK